MLCIVAQQVDGLQAGTFSPRLRVAKIFTVVNSRQRVNLRPVRVATVLVCVRSRLRLVLSMLSAACVFSAVLLCMFLQVRWVVETRLLTVVTRVCVMLTPV